MRKTTKTLLILLLIAGILSILIGFFFRFVFYGTLDAGNDFYERTYRRMIIFFLAGGFLSMISILLLILNKKK